VAPKSTLPKDMMFRLSLEGKEEVIQVENDDRNFRLENEMCNDMKATKSESC
jgi:hypothetical protein